MSKEILADVDRDQIRIGVLEDRQLVEYYVERTNDQRVVGNIYKGKVTNVLPGIQAAFVDIGLGKNAFLFAGDLNSGNQNLDDANGFEDLTKISIKDFLHVGQEVLVQVVKEPMGTKGARVSMNITLPGRYLVLMPMVDYIGISRRIESEVERQRLKALAQEICPPHMGVIVRTVAEGKGFEELKADMEYLKRLWDSILKKQKKCKAPRLIYKDMDLLSRIVRDVFTPEVSKFYVNTSYGYEKVRELASCI